MDKIFTHNFRTHKSTLQKVRNLLKIILCKKNKNHKSQFIRNITLRVLVHYYQALVKTTLPGCNSRGMQQMLNSLECAVKSSWGESIINGRSCVKKKNLIRWLTRLVHEHIWDNAELFQKYIVWRVPIKEQ